MRRRLLRPWHLLLAGLALIVPIQAGALEGGDAEGEVGLAVAASLDYCGVGSAGVVCKIDVTWSGVEGAHRHTASATLADGSVHGFGEVGSAAGGTSLWVPYAGNGVYSVAISAWGTDEQGAEAELVRERAGATVKGRAGAAGDGPAADEEAEEAPAATEENRGPGGEPAEGGGEPAPAEGEPAGAEQPANAEPESPAAAEGDEGEPSGGEGEPTPARAPAATPGASASREP